MKKLLNILLILLAAIGLGSCERDNYDGPDAGVEGVILNKITGDTMQLSQGGGNFSLRIVETSYAHGDSTVVVSPQSLNMKQDGTFLNTKLFAGTYEMYPWESCCYEGKESKQIVGLKSGSRTKVVFEVTPYFEIEWVDEPWQDDEGFVHAAFTFKANPTPDASYTPARPEKAQLFISKSEKVGTGSDARYTNNEYTVSTFDEGNVIELITKAPIDFTQRFWLRVGVKAHADGAHGVYDKYCLSKIKTLDCVGHSSNQSGN